MSNKKRRTLDEAIAVFKINCKKCGRKMTVHAYGKNKQILKKMNTNHPVVSMACWTASCPDYGVEKHHIDKEKK